VQLSATKENKQQLQSELGCCNRIIDVLTKQSYEDELVFPNEPNPRNRSEIT